MEKRISGKNKPMEIFFVTSNKSKFQLVKDRLSSLNIKLLHHSLDIPEIRDYHVKNVALHKARYAFNVLKKPLIVEDRGFYIEALNGFPGTFVNFMHETIGVKGITKLMQNVKNRRATFVSVLAYISSQDNIRLFEETEEGFILENVVDGNCRGWGEIMKIYSHSSYPEKALSQLSDSEWKNYQNIIAKNDYLSKFYDWLKDGKSNF